MPSPLEDVRNELTHLLNPPTDVMVDPSLLVSKGTLAQLDSTRLFEAHTQTTLFQTGIQTRVGSISIPATFGSLLNQQGDFDVHRTEVWSRYKQQATSSSREDIVEFVEEFEIESYAADKTSDSATQQLNVNVEREDENQWLSGILDDTLSFLSNGGVLLLRTGTTLEHLRDGGAPLLDVGEAPLDDGFSEKLERIGYGDSAPICAFGVTNLGTTLDALTDTVIESASDILVYRIG